MRTISLAVTILSLTAALVAAAPASQSVPTTPPAFVVAGPDETQELVMTDGGRLFGRTVRVDAGRVVFVTNAGATLEINIKQILSIRRVEGRVVRGAFWKVDTNPTRLFFAPTGRSLRQGEAYAGVYEFGLPFVQVGLTDRISIGGGTPLFFFGGESGRPFWITPKVQVIRTASWQAAIGAIHLFRVSRGSLGIAYGVVTKGSRDSAVSLGVGYGYERSDTSRNGGPVVMVAGEHRVSRVIKLVSEDYITGGAGVVSGGIRCFGERVALDLGMVVVLGGGDIGGFPIINVVWQFSRR